MKETIKRILCVVLGHDWLWYSHASMGLEWESKRCERCQEEVIDRIFE